MSKVKAAKLSDDILEQVSGGTNIEMKALQDELGVSNLKQITTGLEELGVKAKLSSLAPNEYTDLKTGNPLTQEDVLKKIRTSNK